MNWYFKLVATHPFVVVFVVGGFSVIALVVSITCSKLPNFSDPQLGFETRGTEIAKRLTAWENLYEAARPSGILAVNPLSLSPPSENVPFDDVPLETRGYVRRNKSEQNDNFLLSDVESFRSEEKRFEEKFVDEDWLSEQDDKLDDDHDHDHLSSDGFFCEGLSNNIFYSNFKYN